MITKELIDKINFLAKKQKEEGLNPTEKVEQEKLRKIYIEEMKSRVRESLEAQKKANEDHHHCHGECDCGHKH